jgi:pimeloyl-ACP methyl ester carboxylesterase
VHRVASTDGVEVVVHDLGGDGPPILFAHATGLHGRVWQPVAARLTDFRCWAVDFRGHGDAAVPAGRTFDWHGFGDDILAAVDGLGLDRPFGVGHSKGGAALLLAEEARPGRFAKLWCFDPVVFPTGVQPPGDGGGEHPLAAGAARRRAVFPSRDDAFANFQSKPPFAVVTDEALRAYVDHGFTDQPDGTVALKCAPHDEAQVYRMGAAHDAFAHLDRVTCPVTIARAKIDGMGPAGFAEAIVDALPDGRLDDFPALTHFGPLEAPDEVASSIRAFFHGT